MFRKARRRVRILSLLPAAYWLYKERHVLLGMADFAKTVPDRMRMGRGSEVGLAAKVNLALLREPRLKGADVRLGAVQEGDVCLEVGPGHEAAGEIARRIVESVAGVTTVRIEDTQAHPAPSTSSSSADVASTVAGDGVVESPTGEEAPVRI